MLDQSESIVAPHPPHILERLGPLTAGYGDLAVDDNFARMVDDVCRLVEANPVPWALDTFDRSAVASACHQRSLVAVYGVVHDRLAAHCGAQDWFCKSLANVHYLADLEAYFGSAARYIHLHRDPRDVAGSFLKAFVGEKTTYHVGLQWQDEQEKAIAFEASVPAARYLRVAYSDLIHDPETTLKRIAAFMQIPFSPAMLEFHKSDQARKTAKTGAMWQNVKAPVMSSNEMKFLDQMSLRQAAHLEHVARDSMTRLGYLPACAEWVVPDLDADTLARLDTENTQRKAETRAATDPKDLEARRAQAAVLKEITARLTGAMQQAEA
jgi:hypothetical protein